MSPTPPPLQPFATLLRIYSVTQLNFLKLFSISCLNPSMASYHNQALITSILPIILCLFITIVYVVRRSRAAVVAPSDDVASGRGGSGGGGGGGGEKKSTSLFSEYASLLLSICYVCLPAVTTAQFHGLNWLVHHTYTYTHAAHTTFPFTHGRQRHHPSNFASPTHPPTHRPSGPPQRRAEGRDVVPP